MVISTSWIETGQKESDVYEDEKERTSTERMEEKEKWLRKTASSIVLSTERCCLPGDWRSSYEGHQTSPGLPCGGGPRGVTKPLQCFHVLHSTWRLAGAIVISCYSNAHLTRRCPLPPILLQ